jgi:ABC-type nitrate/sulfonate/bicarbonate transport system permease component
MTVVARPGVAAASGPAVAGLAARVVRRLTRWAAFVGAALLAWWAVLTVFDVEPYFMPGPGTTLSKLWEARGTLADHALVTLWETVAGIAVATGFAVALAVVFVTSPTAERALLPLAVTFRSIPIVAVAPLITLIAGRGLGTSIVCVTIVSFFPVLVNTARGLRALTPEMRELLRVCGASLPQAFRYARFPVTVPFLFAGLRSAAAVAVLGAMLAEWLTGTQGLGYLLTNAAALRDLPLLWSVVIVASSLSLGFFAAMAAVERVLVRWSKGES